MNYTTDIEVGDRIRFTSPCRDGRPNVWRVVTGFWKVFNADGCTVAYVEPTVRYHGCGNFIVHWNEIDEHETV